MKSETKINIASASHIGALYDNGIKLLFQCKEIIVPIMEMVVPEFSDCSQQQIANCLDLSSVSSEEIVSDVALDSDYRIKDEESELSSATDKLIRFDSRFMIKNPKLSTSKLQVNLHIDLEGQKSYRPSNPRYPIVKRALYYVARSFSEQLSVITGKTDYSILEKCYSIWICSEDIPGKLQNTMTQYSIKKKDIFQETDEPEADYDLMTVIIIRRGKGTEKESIFDYLNGIFSCDIDKIEKYSHVEWAETFREEMKTMTGFGDALIEKGREEGIKEGVNNLIRNMYNKNCSVDQIADLTGISQDYIKQALKNKEEEADKS